MMYMPVNHCELCGIKFQAKGKFSLCMKCKKTRKKQARAGMSQWEWELKKVLEQELPNYYHIDNGKYSFMRSPKGASLELDRYYPELDVAFEFDGAQHDEFNSFFHKDEEQFRYYQLCDRIKEEQCEQRGITLIRIKQKKYKDASVFRDLIHKILKKK